MNPQRLLRPFPSLDAYFEAVRALVADLAASGHGAASAALDDGFRCLNGLTDGWALFLDAAEAVRSRYGDGLSTAQRRRLDEVRRVARRIVHRR